eukprot:9632491-Ditylum_brightwellii.AAC.1
MTLAHAEMGYHVNLKEITMIMYAKEDYLLDSEVAEVGTGLGGGFTHMHELRAMKYEEAMAADWEGWTKAVDKEHKRMIKNKVWMPIKLSKVPKGAKILTSTWVCKMKSNGQKRASIKGRGYEKMMMYTMMALQLMHQ